jgi:hypothetical protein
VFPWLCKHLWWMASKQYWCWSTSSHSNRCLWKQCYPQLLA